MYADGPVTKDQSWWGFSIKQGVTTIHKLVLPSLLGPNLEFDSGNGDRNTRSLLQVTVRLKTPNTNWDGKTKCINVQHPLSKTLVDVLSSLIFVLKFKTALISHWD